MADRDVRPLPLLRGPQHDEDALRRAAEGSAPSLVAPRAAAPRPLSAMSCSAARVTPARLSFTGRDDLLLAAALRGAGTPLSRAPLFVRTVDDLEALRFVMLRILHGAWHNVFCIASRLFLAAPRPPGEANERYVTHKLEQFFVGAEEYGLVREFAFQHGFAIGAVMDAVMTDYAVHVRPLVDKKVGDPMAYVRPYGRTFVHG